VKSRERTILLLRGKVSTIWKKKNSQAGTPSHYCPETVFNKRGGGLFPNQENHRAGGGKGNLILVNSTRKKSCLSGNLRFCQKGV